MKKKVKLCTKDAHVVLGERLYRAGYVVRTERVEMVKCPAVVMKSAYTPDGNYIGSARDAHYLVVKRGIRPQLRTDTSNVCSIGYSPKDGKWYGWSHRAIYGFKPGYVVSEGSTLIGPYKAGYRAKNIADAMKMACAFAESVS